MLRGRMADPALARAADFRPRMERLGQRRAAAAFEAEVDALAGGRIRTGGRNAPSSPA